jgi:DNA polymerase-3 subunit gamma/tau
MSNSLFPDSPAQSSGMALARKWRPRDFDTLVGQEHVVRALSHALDQQRLHHAWLFTGTRGVGKTTISRILAKSLNCIGPDGKNELPTSKPCGQCQVCLEIDAGRFVDYIEMDAASNRGVDEMAALLEKAVYAPTNARYKVYMIDEVHMLTSHAFNSMLKTLEEPPPHVKFILATTDPQKIPVTVLSRCLQFNLKQMPPSLIVQHLQDILQKEQVNAEVNALKILAKAASGSMRDALSLTDQSIAYAAGTITEESVRNMLGTLDDSYLIRILDALNQKNGSELVAVAEEMNLSSMSFSLALQDLASLLQKISMAQVLPQSVLEEWPEAEAVQRLAGQFTKEEAQLFYQIAIVGRSDLSLAPDELSGFMMTLLRMLAFKPDNDFGTPSSQGGGGKQSGATSPAPAKSPAQAAMAAVAASSAPKATPAPARNEPPVAQKTSSPAVPENASPVVSGPVDAPVDWQSLIRELPLRGLVQQFAYQTELKSWTDNATSVQVVVVTAMPQIATDDAIARLAQFLENQFGKPFKLKVEAGQVENTVAVVQAQEKKDLQTMAEKQIASDPFIQQLENEIGAKVISGTERPL